jgi:hypothetical protein
MMRRSWEIVALAIVLAAPSVRAADTNKYTGVGSCSASNCHGAAQPGQKQGDADNTSTVWSSKDHHAKAFTNLTNERLKAGFSPGKMAKALKIDSAEKSDKCLTCHADNVPAAQRGPKFDIADGVGCESCHGAAEKWLEPHAKPKEANWSHAKSIENGLYDMLDLVKRAEKCVSCHLAIDHALVTAGHPQPVFELEEYSLSMPKHWPAPYDKAREAGFFGPRAWATGQAIELREALTQLAKCSSDGAPANLIENSWRQAWAHYAVLNRVSPNPAGLDGAIKDKGKAASAAKGAATALGQLAQQLSKKEFDKDGTKTLLTAIAGDSEGVSTIGAHAGAQTAFALDVLYRAYGSADPANKKEINAAIGKLFDDAGDPMKPETFKKEQFVKDQQAVAAFFK